MYIYIYIYAWIYNYLNLYKLQCILSVWSSVSTSDANPVSPTIHLSVTSKTYIYMCVYIYIYIYILIYVSICTWLTIQICQYIHIYQYVHIYIYIYICMNCTFLKSIATVCAWIPNLLSLISWYRIMISIFCIACQACFVYDEVVA
jgi:hypothetical protein